MFAHLIFWAPIGSIAWSDDTPRSPERHRRELSQWQTSNNRGHLIRKQGERAAGNLAASFTLHEADHGSGVVVAIRVHRTFSADSRLRFTVLERPAIGAVKVLDRPGDDAELVHLAANWEAAEAWLEGNSSPNAVLREITADAVAADAVEGRAVA
ncbi:hypothetical protein [Mesorhizobium sp.]|uniref:hypothetical protein n=1 Tax=Mesorhizobium sp. TaxID=1871066 RepID=UPI000FEA8C79|nr:hypothetical protein [Mesorhizobium sp.]RWI83766.1 MAG: hypothetical protein EOR20_20195 [Mesorhizobium sp.]